MRRAPSPPEWFWEPIETDVPAPARRATELPIPEGGFRRLEGAARLWDELPADARDRLRREGVLVLGSELGSMSPPQKPEARRSASFGAFYTHLREQRIPHILTLDSLFALVHLGFVQALAQVEDAELAPALETLLEKLDARLTAEQAGVGTELLEPYRIARSIVGVARALMTSGYTPARELGPGVVEERGLIERSAAITTSPTLGIAIDYSRFAPPSSAARPGAFRALAWLASAPLTLVARGEVPASPVGTAHARTNTRAAMLLARMCDHEVDGKIHGAYTRVRRLLSFVWGHPDDLSLTELDEVAEAAGVDLTKPQDIANVVRVDKVRWRALAGRSPDLYDGTGGAGRAGVGVRIFGGHAAADSIALQSLVGLPLAHEAASDRARNGRRTLPSTLDVAAWLGAPEARAILHESGGDPFEGYDSTLARLHRNRRVLEEGGLHASVHGSLVDALIAWASATPASGIARTPTADRMRVESLLSAWTLARHAGQAMARSRPSPPARASDLRVSGQPLPVLIEPVPEVIGRLLSTVRQIRRGLGTLGSIAPSSPSITSLLEIEDILRTALSSAQRYVSDEPASAEEMSALAALPARIARLEDEATVDVGPIVAPVHADPPSRRMLATATGKIEPVLMLMQDSSSEDPLLVVGAHVAHHEIVGARDSRGGSPRPAALSDVYPALAPAALASIASRPPWVATFRWTR